MSSDLSSSNEFEKLFGKDGSSGSSGGNDEDSSGWMHRIDVSIFRRLASTDNFDDEVNPENVLALQNDVFDVKIPKLSKKRKNGDAGFEYEPSRKCRRYSQTSSFERQQKRKQNISNLSDEDADDDDDDEEEEEVVVKKKYQRVKRKPSVNIAQMGVAEYEECGDGVTTTRTKYPKPIYSYSSLIALALKNSSTGRMQVSEIYEFICETFPFFRTAASGWKNSVRHNLSLSKSFEKIVVDDSDDLRPGRKYCLWALNTEKMDKINMEIQKTRAKHASTARDAFANPDDIDAIESGAKGTYCQFEGKSIGAKTKRPRMSTEDQRLMMNLAKSLEAKNSRVKVASKTVSQSESQVSILKWTKPDAKLEVPSESTSKPPTIVSNTRPLIFDVEPKKNSFSTSSEDEDEEGDDSEDEKPIDLSQRQPSFEKQQNSVEMTPPRSQSSQIDTSSSEATPPPASFSTPIRTPYYQSEPCWSPVFSFTDHHRRQLWQLQYQGTPEKPSFGLLLNNSPRQQSSFIQHTPDTRKRNLRFGTSLEFACSASSPLNNSLIMQLSTMQDQQYQGQQLCFGNMA